jgi:FkbM family methyltransferase
MIRQMLRRAALTFPQLRKLVESRDAALASCELARSQLLAAEAALAAYAASQPDLVRRILKACDPNTWLDLELNGASLWLPRNTLLTMFHCIHSGPDGKLYLAVEVRHLDWMMQRLTGGGTFLDVGASTGATTLPIARRFGDAVRIVSYEPAENARNLLLATLERNRIAGVEVLPYAVSETAGRSDFREFLPDESGKIPYLPEASSLIGKVTSDRPHRTLTVPVVTLDEDALPRCGRKPVVIKIDVEGFETLVLRGSRRLISEFRPWLSIDIHADPFGDGVETTERSVRTVLEEGGYQFERLGHVLVCTPAA